jgi:AbrB family looped-hinge helix DNA binding protein
MSTTIDPAGRVVIPKAVRDAMGLIPGAPIDIAYVDGRIEIEFTPMEADVVMEGRFPVIVPRQPVSPLTDEVVRSALEATRR